MNFTVTEKGLEDQLLGAVVTKERLDLEEQRAELVSQQNQYTIRNATIFEIWGVEIAGATRATCLLNAPAAHRFKGARG